VEVCQWYSRKEYNKKLIFARFRPIIANIGVPHALISDDEFEGYRLPAGTVVTYNHWAIADSTEEYEQPERFWPERFLNEDLDKPTKGHLGFGAGKYYQVVLSGRKKALQVVGSMLTCVQEEGFASATTLLIRIFSLLLRDSSTVSSFPLHPRRRLTCRERYILLSQSRLQ
jgi:hypothetical protein